MDEWKLMDGETDRFNVLKTTSQACACLSMFWVCMFLTSNNVQIHIPCHARSLTG